MAKTANAFAMQLTVQSAWGVVPAYLNESAPEGRAVLSDFVYQPGNFVAPPTVRCRRPLPLHTTATTVLL